MFGLLNRKLSRQWTSKNTTKPLGYVHLSVFLACQLSRLTFGLFPEPLAMTRILSELAGR